MSAPVDPLIRVRDLLLNASNASQDSEQIDKRAAVVAAQQLANPERYNEPSPFRSLSGFPTTNEQAWEQRMQTERANLIRDAQKGLMTSELAAALYKKGWMPDDIEELEKVADAKDFQTKLAKQAGVKENYAVLEWVCPEILESLHEKLREQCTNLDNLLKIIVPTAEQNELDEHPPGYTDSDKLVFLSAKLRQIKRDLYFSKDKNFLTPSLKNQLLREGWTNEELSLITRDMKECDNLQLESALVNYALDKEHYAVLQYLPRSCAEEISDLISVEQMRITRSVAALAHVLDVDY